MTAWKDALRPRRWASVLRWATLAGLELGAIGPFGSYKANLYSRLAYWTVLFWIGAATLWPSVTAALVLAPRRGWPPLFAATAVTLAACVPLAALSWAGCALLWPVHATGIRALEWYALTAVVVLPATAGLMWLELSQRRLPLAAPQAEPAPDAAEPHAERQPLPPAIAAEALCLQMEDHYVRVHLPGRSTLHGATLREAIGDMGAREGIQVHRSWWVARDAVAGWMQEERAVALVLTDGARVPVARQRVALLREAGWLDPARRRRPPPGGLAA